MNTNRLSDWLQVIGLFGIIASLVFVGLEMRQAKEIAIANASQARTATAVELVTTIASDPVIRAALIKQRTGNTATMSADEQTALSSIAYANLLLQEDIYHQYIGGFITEDKWQGSRSSLKTGLSDWRGGPFLRTTYDFTSTNWSPSFTALVEQLILEIETEQPK